MKTSNDKYKFRGIPDCASMWAHRLNLFLENHSSPRCRVTLGVSKREISRYETAIVVLRYACIPVSVNSRVCSTTKTFPPRRGHRVGNEHENGTTFPSRWIAKGDEWHEAFVNFSQHVSCPRRRVRESKIFEQENRIIVSKESRKIDFPFQLMDLSIRFFNLINCNFVLLDLSCFVLDSI